jgi:hypothetical protein
MAELVVVEDRLPVSLMILARPQSMAIRQACSRGFPGRPLAVRQLSQNHTAESAHPATPDQGSVRSRSLHTAVADDSKEPGSRSRPASLTSVEVHPFDANGGQVGDTAICPARRPSDKP